MTEPQTYARARIMGYVLESDHVDGQPGYWLDGTQSEDGTFSTSLDEVNRKLDALENNPAADLLKIG